MDGLLVGLQTTDQTRNHFELNGAWLKSWRFLTEKYEQPLKQNHGKPDQSKIVMAVIKLCMRVSVSECVWIILLLSLFIIICFNVLVSSLESENVLWIWVCLYVWERAFTCK